jgi:mono/diheme cytochrome c family protein
MRFDADGSGGEIYARGLRNSVGLDWAPWDGALYATDNGRDLLGDDFPPCELNRIEREGFYGWPYLNGANVLDPDLGHGRQAMQATAIAPAHGFGAHTAPLGMRFLRADDSWPERYRRSALVALHGSWNRSAPAGYAVVSLHWSDDGSIEEQPFLTGFEFDGDIIGRPVDVVQAPDGAVLVSDDYAGVIYRIIRGEQPVAAAARAAPPPRADAALAALDAAARNAVSEQGRALYGRYGCGNCHQPARVGGRALRPLEQLPTRYDLDSLSAFFVAPTPPMPVFPLSPEERQALAVYLLTRQ